MPRRILVCRVNRRLGNTVLLTPLLQSLAATFPSARVDVLIQGQYNGRLLCGLPGVDKIIELPTSPGILLWKIIPLIVSLRWRRYDLAVDPNGHSLSNRVAMLCAAARYRLGFASPDQCLRLTHAVTVPPENVHMGLEPLALLAAISDPAPTRIEHLAVGMSDSERERASIHLKEAIGSPCQKTIFGFFAHATGDKELSEHWWVEWCREVRTLHPEAILVQIVRPGCEAVSSEVVAIGTENLRELAAMITQFDRFIAADSGPMHLAAACGVPVLGLFKTTPPGLFAPLGPECGFLNAPLAPAEAAKALIQLPSARRRQQFHARDEAIDAWGSDRQVAL
ncbi:glycosyltransferase family 9 protein [Spectribacter hydrogenoxidans]|uniref:Glycosyltransferase family 9 protein n=1 Tax=Spectribacter hydrogenoxidans TaxID=3075608 RepID=A0ABU3C2U3_9GAMM|nr:glycosyltransferase family 9 protein [Salinisphaera sp. W335]MDT0635874.1 glycosyltransferase family 9 protein [Salinisphaera sp. W335]